MQSHYDILRMGFLDLSKSFELINYDKLIDTTNTIFITLTIIIILLIIIDYIYIEINKRIIFKELEFLMLFLNNPDNVCNSKFNNYVESLFKISSKNVLHQDLEDD